MRYRIKVLAQVGIKYLCFSLCKIVFDHLHRSLCASVWSESMGAVFEVRFKDRLQYHLAYRLHTTVPDCRNSQWTFSSIGFRAHTPLYCLRTVGPFSEFLPQFF